MIFTSVHSVLSFTGIYWSQNSFKWINPVLCWFMTLKKILCTYCPIQVYIHLLISYRNLFYHLKRFCVLELFKHCFILEWNRNRSDLGKCVFCLFLRHLQKGVPKECRQSNRAKHCPQLTSEHWGEREACSAPLCLLLIFSPDYSTDSQKAGEGQSLFSHPHSTEVNAGAPIQFIYFYVPESHAQLSHHETKSILISPSMQIGWWWRLHWKKSIL